MSCGSNTALDALKDKQNELNAKLKEGKDALGDLTSKLDEMKAELDTFKPTLPKVESLQDKINELSGITNPLDVTSKIAELKSKFEGAVPNLEKLLGDLGLNEESLLGKLGIGDVNPEDLINSAKSDVCGLIPNVEASEDGTVKEQPSEPKVPEEPPVAEEPTPVIEKDVYELNRALIGHSYRNTIKWLAAPANAGSIFSGFGSKKKNKIFFEATWPEFWFHLYKAAGETQPHKFTYTREDLTQRQNKLKSKYPKAEWNFDQGAELEVTYNLLKEKYSNQYAGVSDFATAAKEAVARHAAKAAAKEV